MSMQQAVTVDVREDIERGREPFSKIMMAVSGLEEGQDLVLITPFEPVPLYSVLGARGFTHESKALDKGNWEVRFTQLMGGAAKSVDDAGPTPHGQTEFVDVDARGLEPPQPLVAILQALNTLANGQKLRAHTDRRPMHLFAQLEERGFAWNSEEQPDGSFITCAHAKP